MHSKTAIVRPSDLEVSKSLIEVHSLEANPSQFSLTDAPFIVSTRERKKKERKNVEAFCAA